jgi:hypothetical protein
MCRLFSNLGASTFWDPVGLSGHVMGLLLPVMEGWRTTKITSVTVTGHRIDFRNLDVPNMQSECYQETAKLDKMKCKKKMR